jgi:hypothetical protein
VNKKYVVRLTDEERQQLQTLVRRGEAHTRKLLYARILLAQGRREHGEVDR